MMFWWVKIFLTQMNNFLNKYSLNKKIASIEGYMYPVSFDKNVPEYYFLKGSRLLGVGNLEKILDKL